MVFLEAELDSFKKPADLVKAGRSVAVRAVAFIDGLGYTSVVLVLCSPIQRRYTTLDFVPDRIWRTPNLFGNPVWRPFIH